MSTNIYKYKIPRFDFVCLFEGQPLSDEVSQLLKDIEEFRAFMTDEYAEEIANNLQGDCITH